MTGPGDEAVVRRVLPVAPEVAYDEWLDPDGMLEWMCPHPARPLRIRLDASIGGQFVIDFEDGGVEATIAGRYIELDRPRRLRFTWSCSTWPDPDHASEVTVTLDGRADGTTLMTIRHLRLPSGLAEGHLHGWEAIGEQLAQRLALSAQP